MVCYFKLIKRNGVLTKLRAKRYKIKIYQSIHSLKKILFEIHKRIQYPNKSFCCSYASIKIYKIRIHTFNRK